jgi:hypothetical protein
MALEYGIVSLSGTVPTYIEKSAAEKAAQRVSGVIEVTDKEQKLLLELIEGEQKQIIQELDHTDITPCIRCADARRNYSHRRYWLMSVCLAAPFGKVDAAF